MNHITFQRKVFDVNVYIKSLPRKKKKEYKKFQKRISEIRYSEDTPIQGWYFDNGDGKMIL